MQKILVITGPTATGKTALAAELGRRLGGEVVSADSMQIYRRMDIGTAKPTAEETLGVPHHMLDAAEPWEDFSAAKYAEMASKCVDDILSRGRLAIVAGGTGLYIDALVRGAGFSAIDGSGRARAELESEFDALGGEKMLEKLARADPERALKLHPADRKRIIRALEVFELTGETITEHDRRESLRPPRYDALTLALAFEDRADLYGRIDRRVDVMLERGLLDEVRALLDSGVPEKCTAMQAIGYKELVPVLRGTIPLCAAAETIKRGSRRYAKRQLTWLRARDYVKWINWKKSPDIEKGIQISTSFLAEYGII